MLCILFIGFKPDLNRSGMSNYIQIRFLIKIDKYAV